MCIRDSGKAARGFRTIAGKDYYFSEKTFEGINEGQLIITDKDGIIL